MECSVPSPETGQLCTLGKGHFGAHKVGGPYHTVEEFVIKCTDKPCNYHPNSRLIGKRQEKYHQCIYCGHVLSLHRESPPVYCYDDTFGIFNPE